MINLMMSGLRHMRRHTQLIFVTFLIIFFPLLFVYTVNEFISVTKANTNSVLQQKITSLHDSIEQVFTFTGNVDDYLINLSEKQKDLKKVRIVEDEGTKLVIVNKLPNDKSSTTVSNIAPYRSSLLATGETFIHDLSFENREATQAIRAITLEDGNTYYIFTEHDFSNLYMVLENRINKAYFSLAFIFLFLIILAYWMAKQIDYRRLYLDKKNDLEERDLFIDSLAHEFRTPLTAIKGYASLVEEDDTINNTIKDYASKIRSSSSRLVTLVNDFLEAAHIQSGKLKITTTNDDVKIVIDKVISQLKPLAETKNLELKTALPDTPVLATTDFKRLEQILINITNNAIKYTDKGEVEVSLEKNIFHTIIVVADTGDGISAEDQKKLFAPFVRVGKAKDNTKITGSGLGMWITRLLIEQLGGSISVESIKGVGTHVIIKLNNNKFKF